MLNHYYTIINKQNENEKSAQYHHDDELSKTMLNSESATMSHRYSGDSHCTLIAIHKYHM